MADLNPLKFQVAIQDEATGQLDKIEQEFKKLQDKTINVKVEGLQDLQHLLSALQHKQVETLGRDVASGIHDAAKGLQEEAQKAVRASLGQLAQDLVAVKTAIQHDNFTAFSNRIQTCAEKVNLLDEAFKKFHVTIGTDAGMKNFMTGLGEVIRNVRTTMGTLEVSKGGGGALSSLAYTYARNVERIEDALFRLQEARAKVSNAIKSAEGAGMDSNIISRWRIYLQVLDAYEKKLQNIKTDDTLMNGRGWQTNAFGTTFKHLLSNASDFEKAANVFIRAQEKLSAAREKATGMNAGAAAQRGVSLISGQSTQEIRKQIDAIGALYMRIQELSNLTHSRSSFNKQLSFNWNTSKIPEKDLLEVYSQTFSKLRAELKTLKESGYDVSGFKSQLDSLYATYEKFAALQPVDLGKKLGLEHVKGYTGPSSAATDTQWAAMKHQAEVQEVAGEAAKRHQRKLEELTNAFAQHDAQVAKSQRVQEGDNKARQESAAALRKQAQELVKARMEMLRTQSADLGKLLSMGRGALGSEQYDAVRNALRGVREEMRQIEGVMQRMDSYSTRSLFSIGRGTTQDYTPLISNTQKLVAAKEQATQASHQMTAAEQQLAHALNQTSESARGQSQVLSDLKSMATQYLGVWGGQQFLHNIIEIGGQLEMQRLSIGAILQNTSQANELFDKIKGLATQSPFGVVQLDQMTKQLTAYGFKYNELYDMTKRLADISAATGTDVSRLALALGHVRSEAALSGYTLRQFSMANVPLLQKLSEKLGKTTKEIRDMVKKKEVGYDDVIGVLKDLTNEGGMFYNMQEVIAQSVKAKFKNVKDAMDIMYGEMAEGLPGDVLKQVADVLMEVTRNWKDAFTIIGTGAAVWAAHRAALLTMNAALGSNTAAVTSNMLAYKQKRAAELQNEALTRRLTAEELSLIATRKQITAANIRVALSTNAMTKGEALRLVGLRKLSLEEAKALIRSGQFTAAEVRMAMQGRLLGFSLKRLGIDFEFAGIKFGKAGMMLKLFAVKAKEAMAALLANPWTWAMAGITAMMELWQRNNQELERAKELNDAIYERSQEGLKNTRAMMQRTGIRVVWKSDENDKWTNITGSFGQQRGGRRVFYKPSFEKNNDIEGTIEAWQQYIRDYAATPNRILNEAMTYQETTKGEDGIERITTKVREQEEQYDRLYESVINVAKAQVEMARLSDVMEFSVNETNAGWFGDDLLTNIGDYDKQVKKVSQSIAKTYGSLRKHIDETIIKAQKEDKSFAKATEGMDNYSQAFDHLVRNHEKFAKADEIFKGAHFGVAGAYESLLDGGLFDGGTMSGLDNARETMEEDLNKYFTSLDGMLRNLKGWNIDEVLAGKMTLSEDKQQALLSSWREALSKVQGLTDETASELTKKFSERYHIQIDADTENAIVKLAMVEQSLNNLVDGDYKVNVETMTNAESVFDQLKKDYKAAKSYIETSKPILAKFGISFTGKALSQEQINKALSMIPNEDIRGEVAKILVGFNQAMGQLGKTQEAANNIGLKLEDDKKKSKGSGTGHKSSGSKAYKDEFAKRWDERIRIMKEAHDWYRKWEKEVGHDEAIKETFAKYQDIFKEWKEDKILPLDFDVNDIDDFQKYVEKIYKDALDRYNKQKNNKLQNYGQEAQRVYRQAAAVLEDIKFDNFKEAAEEFRSIIDQTIEDLNERWDIFDAIRNATGNVGLATRIAGFGAAEVGARTSADAMRNELLSQLRSAGGENLLSKIPLDVKIDEEGLRTKFEKAIPQGEDAERYKEKIDGLIKAYQEWQKLQKKVIKDDVNVFANLIGSAVSYDAQIKKLQDKLKQQKDSINASVSAGTISQADADKANEIAQAQFDWEKVKLSADYANIYNNAIAMSREEFDRAAGAVERMLEKLRELELISPEDYVSERDKLNKARNEWSTTGFLGERGAVGQFISGGYDGLMDYYAKRRDNAQEKANRSEKGSQEQKDAQQEADHYGKLFTRMSKLSDAAKDVVTAFSTLQSGLDLVTNLFDSMGNEGVANAVGDAAGVMGGAMQGAQSLSALGPWGMAAGAGLGLISGLFQLHDKRLERQIEKLREDVQKIEANTKLIQQARERTLGFDTGELRRSYAQDYAPNQTQVMKELLAKKAQKDMYEYYGNNSSGTGYQQEYQNLLDQRKDYLEILNKQESKKKKSQSDIEETKIKIAELDDQIRYFTQDLAKELFDIDIKGWADQLSDALSSAFENGESMAKAYKETVTSILQQVMNKMMQLAILEPMFQSLQDKLFGNAEKNISGVFDPNDPKGSMGKVTAMITDFFGKGGEGEKTITAATEFMTAFQRGVQNAGLSVLNESSNTLSSGVQGTSEETSDLLAGYVNALRQDVAIKRILLTQFVTELWPSYIEQVSQAIRALNNIDTNVAAIRALLSENGTIYLMIDSMRSHFDNITNGNEQVNIH